MSAIPFKAAVAEIAEWLGVSNSAVLKRIAMGRLRIRTMPDPINPRWKAVETAELDRVLTELRLLADTWIPFGQAIVEVAQINGTSTRTALVKFYRRKPRVDVLMNPRRRSAVRRSQLLHLAEQLA